MAEVLTDSTDRDELAALEAFAQELRLGQGPAAASAIPTKPPLVGWELGAVQPMHAAYLDFEVVLRLAAINSRSGLTLSLQGRYLTIAGEVVPFRFTFSPPATRAISQVDIPLAEGFLLDCEITVSAASSVQRGECYVLLLLHRGRVDNSFQEVVLLADYATTFWGLSFPFGTLRHFLSGRGLPRLVTGTNPAAGAEVSETVPTGARWKLLSFAATLVTSATVATRHVRLSVARSGVTYIQVPAALSQAASVEFIYNFSPLGAWFDAFPAAPFSPWPHEMFLLAGDQIVTQTLALQAGDNWGAPTLYVEEWIEA